MLLIQKSLNYLIFKCIPPWNGFCFHKPSIIKMFLTYKCNLRCRHCTSWQLAPNELSRKNAFLIIGKLKQWLGTFVLCIDGGEPFLWQALPEFIEYLFDNGIASVVRTNGTCLTKITDMSLLNKISLLNISLDGADAATHDAFRGKPGCFNQAMACISHALNKTRLRISSVVHDGNICQLEDLVAFAEKINTPIMLNPLNMLKTPSPQSVAHTQPLWPVNTNDVVRVFDALIDRKRSSKSNLLLNSCQNLERMKLFYSGINIIPHGQNACTLPINQLIIRPTAECTLCNQFSMAGNIIESLPQNIWNGEEARRFRRAAKQCPVDCVHNYMRQDDYGWMSKLHSAIYFFKRAFSRATSRKQETYLS